MEMEVRRLDSLGRLVIPTAIRNQLQLENETACSLRVNGSKIEVEKYEPTCIFCGDKSAITNYNNKSICQNCIDNIKKK